MVGGRLVIVQDVEDAREGRVEECGEGERGERGPEQDGEEFGHWWKTSTLQDSFAFVKHLSARKIATPKQWLGQPLGYPIRPLWLALGSPLTAGT